MLENTIQFGLFKVSDSQYYIHIYVQKNPHNLLFSTPKFPTLKEAYTKARSIVRGLKRGGAIC